MNSDVICPHCGTDLNKVEGLRAGARFCSKKHQDAYWRVYRKMERQIDIALNAIDALEEIAASDTILASDAKVYIIEIYEAGLAVIQRLKQQ